MAAQREEGDLAAGLAVMRGGTELVARIHITWTRIALDEHSAQSFPRCEKMMGVHISTSSLLWTTLSPALELRSMSGSGA